MGRYWRLLLPVLSLWLAGCRALGPAAPPTLLAAAATPPPPTETRPPGEVPPTWTPAAVAGAPSPTALSPLQWTARPSATPWPTFTPRPPATRTPTNTAAPPPTNTPGPTGLPGIPIGPNLLPNRSFEEGWYHIDGIPELQVPNRWQLEWDVGHNPLDPDPWNAFVRPESRVLPSAFLPAHERPIFIWDGDNTLKIFKRQGALSFRLLTDVPLEEGLYQMQVSVFADMVLTYTLSGGKIYADDPLAGELQFRAGQDSSIWILPEFGRRNTFTYNFYVTGTQTVRLGVAFRGRWAITNNGWFMDDWYLWRLSN